MRFTDTLEEHHKKLYRQLEAKKISLEKFNRLVDKLMDWEENYYEKMEEEN